MRAEKVPELQTAGSTVINGKLMLTMDPLPGDLRRLMAQFVFLEIDCIRVDRFWGGGCKFSVFMLDISLFCLSLLFFLSPI